jgi:predicted enzyme related to lactoylglutathione lyase
VVKYIAFTMYPVKDMARARRFYEQDLGLTVSSVHVQGAWVEYHLENGCLALSSMVPELQPSSNSGGIALEVDDVDALVKKLDGKASIKVPPTQTKVCRMAVVVDPEGNSLILHKRNPDR